VTRRAYNSSVADVVEELFPGSAVVFGETLRGSSRTREAAGLRALAGSGCAAEVVAELAARGPECPVDETPQSVREFVGLFTEQAGVVGLWRYVVWDVANLTLPWPTCWCAWRMPDDVARAALDRYRAETRALLPHVDTAGFDVNLRAAEAAWAVITSAWYLRGAFAGDRPHPDPRVVAPRRKALIPHRLARAAEITELPALSAFASRLAGALADHWAPQPLALTPALR